MSRKRNVKWFNGSSEEKQSMELFELLKKENLIQIPEKKMVFQKDMDLETADLVLGGGRILKKEGFFLLEKLANQLGGAVGCTRPCISGGWAKESQMIGHAGVSIKPDLYLAFAISGAIQHISGILDSKCIIGINNNPNAILFQYCDYGIVGDAFLVLEHLSSIIQKNITVEM